MSDKWFITVPVTPEQWSLISAAAEHFGESTDATISAAIDCFCGTACEDAQEAQEAHHALPTVHGLPIHPRGTTERAAAKRHLSDGVTPAQATVLEVMEKGEPLTKREIEAKAGKTVHHSTLTGLVYERRLTTTKNQRNHKVYILRIES